MNNLKSTKAILIDMDGTLVDTEPVGPDTMLNFFNKYNIQISKEDWILFDKVWRRDDTNITFEAFLAQIFNKYKNISDIENHINIFFDDYEKNIMNAKPLPGVNEGLYYLKGSFDLALVTASTTDQLNIVLNKNKWDNIFDLRISHDDFTKSKPDPESFLLAAKKLNVLPEECIVIEDSKNGVLAGKNAGMLVIAIKAGNKHPQDISKADIIVDTFYDVKSLFNTSL